METKIPKCIGIIMDGNRRWAKAHGMPIFEGHRKGYQKLKEVTDWAKEFGIGAVIVYAFSEENWKRTEEEVSFMMGLIREFLVNEKKEIIRKNICLKSIGDISKFPEDIAKGIHDVERESENNTGITLVIAVSYGGRQEITHAVNQLIQENKTGTKSEVTAEDIGSHLYTAGVPDPDLIIRTSGEMRLSGFLSWQSVYSELFFTKTFWPDFSKEEFLKILEEYTSRERRLGK